MPPKPPPPPDEPIGPMLPSPISGRGRRVAQTHQETAAESLSIEERMLEKLTSIEKMVGLFYRLVLWQIIFAVIGGIVACAGVFFRK